MYLDNSIMKKILLAKLSPKLICHFSGVIPILYTYIYTGSHIIVQSLVALESKVRATVCNIYFFYSLFLVVNLIFIRFSRDWSSHDLFIPTWLKRGNSINDEPSQLGPIHAR